MRGGQPSRRYELDIGVGGHFVVIVGYSQ